MPEIIVYYSNTCPYCIKVKSFFRERNIDFTEIEIHPESQEWKKMKQKTGSGSLPQILINDDPIGGYSDLVSMDVSGKLSELSGAFAKKDVTIYDTIIIGGGPAGLSAAVYAARKVMKTLLISKNIGGQIVDTWDIDNYLGFSQIETVDLINRFNEHVDKYGIEKIEGKDVSSLELTGKIKKVVTEDEKSYLAKTIIIATGKRPRPLNVSGEKKLTGKGVAYCSTCDAPLFAGADVAVVGGGNSALEAVIDLEKVASKVYMVSLTPLTGDQVLQEKVKNFDKVEIFTEYTTEKILGESMVEGVEIKSLSTGEAKKIDAEGIFIEIGLLPNSDIVIDILETNRIGEIVTNRNCKTGIPGVFACGDVTDVPFKQVIIAAGEGAMAALSANEYLINQK